MSEKMFDLFRKHDIRTFILGIDNFDSSDALTIIIDSGEGFGVIDSTDSLIKLIIGERFGYVNGSISETFNKLSGYENIEKLVINEVEAGELPIGFDRLISLKELLILSDIQSFESIERLPNLESLGLTPKLSSLHSLSKSSLHQKIKSLFFSRSDFSEFPRELLEFSNLNMLLIENSKLASLPDEIRRFINLTVLVLDNNELTNLPAEVWQLANLTILDLSGNQLTYLPSEIGQLTKLISLNMSTNKLTNLPAELWQLTNMTSLNLSNNELIDLSAEIGNLANLTTLKLSNNRLTILHSEIGQIINLTSLDISDNEITNLPAEILNLKVLKELDLQRNKLEVSPEILSKTKEPQAVLNYLAWIWGGKRQPLSETKMLVVGQGNVGKTSLIRRLTNNEFSSSETKTDGIAINRWQVANTQIGDNQPESLRVNIWDFGGQEIMHATHQFFLTRRSLYILVVDSRSSQEENRVEYWLKIIQSFGDVSPVLLVGNKTDQHPLDIDRTGLQKKYPNIVGILETSAATGIGLDELKSVIAKQVNALPHVRDAIPEAWFNVKAQLEELGCEQNYISQEKYEEKCAELNVKDELSQRTLIGFLHDLGIVLHFQDDPRLEALGILNPQWVTNGVYKILNAHILFQNKGVLERSMLAEILSEKDYPANKRLFIVDMMRKFELCYDIVSEQTFLVPDLLPKDEPFTGEWEGTLAFQYHYNILPSSIISRFIVRINAYIHQTVWRSGVILRKDGNTALVKADTEDRKIYIWVGGDEPTRRDFLSAISAEFDTIHKTIIKIEATKKVPHPDYSDLVLDYAELLQFERDGILEFPRSVSGRTVIVSVHQLLNGVRSGEAPNAPIDRTPKREVDIPKPETPPTKPIEPTVVNQSLFVKISEAVFIYLPRVIGRFALDIFGRGKDAADSTFVVLGYLLLILVGLVIWGIVDINSLRDWFAGWWRFFFPVK